LVAEATIMRNGIRAAAQAKAGFTNIQVEGDNKILIQAIQEKIQPLWEIQTLVHDILFICATTRPFAIFLVKEIVQRICWHSLAISYILRLYGTEFHIGICFLSFMMINLGRTFTKRAA